MSSIKTALAEAVALLQHNSPTPLLDAEILLCHILQQNRSHLRAWPERALSADQHKRFSALLVRRGQGEPVAYLTGTREFWSRDFLVTPDVLIPRPETELIIELSLDWIPKDQPWRILDLGTGSGILAITLAAERPLARITAADISPTALEVAQRNAKLHHISNVEFIESDWFGQITPGAFDLIVSNPPYVAEGDPHLHEGDLRFEPQTALTAGDDGLSDLDAIAGQARSRLVPGGILMMEHGNGQGNHTRGLLAEYGYWQIASHADLAGHPRVTVGRYGQPPAC